jgi:hypothetical protein
VFGRKKTHIYRMLVTREYDIKSDRALDVPELNYVAREGSYGGSITFQGDEWPTAHVKERRDAMTYKVEEDI